MIIVKASLQRNSSMRKVARFWKNSLTKSKENNMVSKGYEWIITHFVWFVLVYEKSNLLRIFCQCLIFLWTFQNIKRLLKHAIRHFAIITLLRPQRVRKAVASHVVRCWEPLTVILNQYQLKNWIAFDFFLF